MKEELIVDDNELIAKYLAGDKLAFEALVSQYQQRIYNFSLRLVQNPEDAADLTQEIFILALRKLNTFRRESKFSTWLYSVACNTCKDFLRRKKRVSSLSDSPFLADKMVVQCDQESSSNDPARKLEKKEIRDAVNQGIAELPVDYRMVIVLRDIQDFSYNEITELLGISMGTVKSRLSRARFKLAKKLYKLREQLEY